MYKLNINQMQRIAESINYYLHNYLHIIYIELETTNFVA